MYPVEKTVPVATDDPRCKYPFARLEVGDSFFVPGMRARALSNASQHHARLRGHRYKCRTVEGGARCWRIA